MTKKNKKILITIIAIVLTVFVFLLKINLNEYLFEGVVFSNILFVIASYYITHKNTVFYNKTNERVDIPQSIINNESEVIVNEEVMDWAKGKEDEIKQLKANEKFRKEFIGNVAHELKTPIFNIQGYVLTLLDGGWKDKKISRKYLERTERNINRLLSLITDIDTISQMESGSLKMRKTNFNIINLIEEIFEMQEINCKKRNISLDFDGNFKKDESYVYADEEKIFEVLLNLIENSIKYGIQNGETGVRVFKSEKKLNIQIFDNGIGIAKEHVKRIFERFYRVDKSRSREMGGSGLGLAIVKHIIESHKQKISIKSTEGEGTTFTFTLAQGKKELLVDVD